MVTFEYESLQIKMGGILVFPYLGWINSVLAGGSGGGGGGGGGGGNGGGKGPPSGQTGSLAPITSESFPMNFGSIIISSSTPANGGFSFSVADSLFEHPTSLQTTPIMEESHWDEPVQVAAAHIAHLKVGAVDNESKSDTMQKRKRVESIDLVHTDWSSEDSNLYDSLFRT